MIHNKQELGKTIQMLKIFDILIVFALFTKELIHIALATKIRTTR